MSADGAYSHYDVFGGVSGSFGVGSSLLAL